MNRASTSLSLLATIAWALPALALPSETLSPVAGHPKITTKVSGSGFVPGEGVDVYFDTADELLVIADGAGNFSGKELKVPADALPGTHWITALGRKDGEGAQAAFAVRTAWAEHGFSPNGKRNNPYENVITAGNVSTLDVAWTATTGSVVSSSPAVANGIVYVGSLDGKLYARNASTGAVKWTATTGGELVSSPAVAAGVVYVGASDGKVYARNASTGVAKWTTTIGSGVDSSPAVANGVVYDGTLDGHLVALNASTGAVEWTAPAGNFVESSPAVADGVVYVGSDDG
jgi:outer membrane protein assembly factor BamB